MATKYSTKCQIWSTVHQDIASTEILNCVAIEREREQLIDCMSVCETEGLLLHSLYHLPEAFNPMQRIRLNPQHQYHAATGHPGDDDLMQAIALDICIGSTVQLYKTQPPKYGVVRWIGELPGAKGQVAGIELEEYMEGCSDGTWQQAGIKYFHCPNGKGIFYPTQHLRRDERFSSNERDNPLHGVPQWEAVDQNLEPHPQQMLKYIGERRGIQGHQNSCYLDATVFGLFALSDVFDSRILAALDKTTDFYKRGIGFLLWKGIVNPLRKNGIVKYEVVMRLRRRLDELGKREGICEDEKDPEEFLNMLFKHILCVEPFIEIRRPFGLEKEYFVQLFLEFDESTRLPTVGDLLRKMFNEQNISFTEMPSQLLIQVPRFGKHFKTYEKIVPDLKLRITDLTDTYQNVPIPNCFICGRRAEFSCMDCSKSFHVASVVNLCGGCDKQVHVPKERVQHSPRGSCYEELDLLSVICIETSHYVCFSREPHQERGQPSNWIFFDSMANRLYDTYNIPKVTDCTAELNEWIYPANGDRTQLMSTPSKNLPEYVRRYTKDVYMCVYGLIGSTPGLDYMYVPYYWEDVYQNLEPHSQQMLKYIGDGRGIQGHQNSCYLDATVFGLFALSDVFDSAVHNNTGDLNGSAIEDMLWSGIVNPLRKNGVVRYESVMRLRSMLDEVRNKKGITYNCNDPEGLLCLLFKDVLEVEPFIGIRRPFGVEKEYFVPLFFETDESMRLPTVGDLLRVMFNEQKISFTEMPSRLLIQIPRYGDILKTFGIIPDLKLRIIDLTDTYQNAQTPNCFICGRRAVYKCTDCSKVLHVPASVVNLCDSCDVQVHLPKERADHPPRASYFKGVLELDLLSVVCSENSHYVCFVREPHQEPGQPSNWIFFDSMANRIYNTYNIPKVTDCTAELNEWIYPANGDRTQLMSTPSKNLPEYVRRFTQESYMCVYGIMNLKSDDQFEKTGSNAAIGDTEVLQKQLSQEKKERELLQQQVSLKNDQLDQLQNDNTRLQQEITKLQQVPQEIARLEEQLTSQRRDYQQQLLQERAVAAEEKQRMINSHSQTEQQLRSQLRQMQVQLQRQVENKGADDHNTRYTQLQVPPQGQNSWNVPRCEVEIIEEIGRGGWGLVLKGRFKGQTVAVKQAFKEILGQPYTIRLMKREIQIMASIQHPNLVRFIAAVIDDKVDRGEETPLLVLEMLDMDLRRAYKTTDLGTNRISIFRDVAYGLHYLHEHQEPIIHRDVSAPNVLLERIQGGTYRAKLSDFGSANKAKDSQTAGPGAICYTAPEAFPPVDLQAPVPPQTPKVDVYSYGILLAEVVTKTMPTTENRRQLLNEVKRTWTLMHDLICLCTKPTPSDRPTMASILNTLNRIPTPRPRQ